jgi:hypothetical protein
MKVYVRIRSQASKENKGRVDGPIGADGSKKRWQKKHGLKRATLWTSERKT